MKIGITERGDASRDYSWLSQLLGFEKPSLKQD